MALPNAEDARVEHSKIEDYLLNREHPDGQGKASFFRKFGFRKAEWYRLADALRNQGHHSEVTSIQESTYGTRYVVDGPIETPTGHTPHVRTVWIVEHDLEEVGPRLVTAYPHSPTDQ